MCVHKYHTCKNLFLTTYRQLNIVVILKVIKNNINYLFYLIVMLKFIKKMLIKNYFEYYKISLNNYNIKIY